MFSHGAARDRSPGRTSIASSDVQSESAHISRRTYLPAPTMRRAHHCRHPAASAWAFPGEASLSLAEQNIECCIAQGLMLTGRSGRSPPRRRVENRPNLAQAPARMKRRASRGRGHCRRRDGVKDHDGRGRSEFRLRLRRLSDTLKMARNLVRQGGRPSLTRRAVATASLHSST